MAATETIYEVFTVHGNLDPNWFIKVIGPTPDWVYRIAKPFSGEVPAGRPVFPVNVEAEMRERAEAERALAIPVTQQLDEPKTIAYLQQKTGCTWTQADFDRRSAIGFPGAHRRGTGYAGTVDGGVVWFTSEIDRWLAGKREELAVLQRLVGVSKK